MGNVVNRITGQIILSVNSPDYPAEDWIHDPSNWAEILTWKRSHRVITGDVVSLADQATQAAIDAAELEASLDAQADEIDAGYARAFALVVLDEINALRAQHGLAPRTVAQLKTAIRNKMDN